MCIQYVQYYSGCGCELRNGPLQECSYGRQSEKCYSIIQIQSPEGPVKIRYCDYHSWRKGTTRYFEVTAHKRYPFHFWPLQPNPDYKPRSWNIVGIPPGRRPPVDNQEFSYLLPATLTDLSDKLLERWRMENGCLDRHDDVSEADDERGNIDYSVSYTDEEHMDSDSVPDNIDYSVSYTDEEHMDSDYVPDNITPMDFLGENCLKSIDLVRTDYDHLFGDDDPEDELSETDSDTSSMRRVSLWVDECQEGMGQAYEHLAEMEISDSGETLVGMEFSAASEREGSDSGEDLDAHRPLPEKPPVLMWGSFESMPFNPWTHPDTKEEQDKFYPQLDPRMASWPEEYN